MSQQPQYGYSQGFNQPAGPQFETRRSNNTGRNCFIIFAVFFCFSALACTGMVIAGGFFVKEAVDELIDEYGNTLIETSWTGAVTTGDFGEIVCPDSPAESYSLQFVEDNPNITAFEVTTIEEDPNNTEKVDLSGIITYSTGETRNYDATFYFKKAENDTGFSQFGLNCIDVIEENLQ